MEGSVIHLLKDARLRGRGFLDSRREWIPIPERTARGMVRMECIGKVDGSFHLRLEETADKALASEVGVPFHVAMSGETSAESEIDPLRARWIRVHIEGHGAADCRLSAWLRPEGESA